MVKRLDSVVVVFDNMAIPFEYLRNTVLPNIEFLSTDSLRTTYEGPVSEISTRTIKIQNNFDNQGYLTYHVRDCDGKDILGELKLTASEVNKLALEDLAKSSGYD